jgi:hypothetical protein
MSLQETPQPIDADPSAADAGAPRLSRRARIRASLQVSELVIDKFVDFILIFVGLYAAIAVQRCQDTDKEKDEYVALLQDFKTELSANLTQEASIEKDLGSIAETKPGKNLGPMATTFDEFFTALAEDEKVVHCLHVEYAADAPGLKLKKDPAVIAECHALYAKFDKQHSASSDPFLFHPAVLTPFYHYEVWQLYLADGVKTFRNKDLAVKLGELYNNARLIEKQVADIESTYNDAFMVQVARSAATDSELAEIVHDEEEVHGLSPQNQQALVQVLHNVKEERYAAKEAKSVVELKVERMKKTVLLLREEIVAVQAAIDAELAKVEG